MAALATQLIISFVPAVESYIQVLLRPDGYIMLWALYNLRNPYVIDVPMYARGNARVVVKTLFIHRYAP
jgi:hypothetical protein